MACGLLELELILGFGGETAARALMLFQLTLESLLGVYETKVTAPVESSWTRDVIPATKEDLGSLTVGGGRVRVLLFSTLMT